MPSLTNLSEKDLYYALLQIFPGKLILQNVRKEANVVATNGHFLELDVWIPDLKLAFEFQDSYHYSHVWYSNEPQTVVQKRDSNKHNTLKERGETLVVVPCWWNGKIESLKATIQQANPNIFGDIVSGQPIPSHPPNGFFSANRIPDIGGFMLATFPSSIQHIDNWWFSEKYDGIRILWNPNRQKFYLRTAREILAPRSIAQHFPSLFFDSEIWFGRRSFEKCQRFITRDDPFISKSDFRFVVFDCVDSNLPFEKRYTQTISLCRQSNPILIVATNVKIITSHVESMLAKITNNFGEGLVARKPESLYHIHSRSDDLVKLKVKREIEGLVTNIINDMVEVSLPNETCFSLQLKNEWKKRLKQGDIITLSYKNISSLGIPFGAKIQRVRKDTTWEQILIGSKESIQTLTEVTNSALAAQTNTRGYWTSNDRRNIINFFDNFAKEKEMDSRNPSSWYNISQQDIISVPDGNSVLSHYGGSFIKALLDIYPDIGLDITNFTTMPKGFWRERENLLNFFNKFAEQKGFDPLISSHWYNISKESIRSHKGGESVLKFCKGSYFKLLISLYPKIGLSEDQFRKHKREKSALSQMELI